jgi:microsomal dipeptidase-like Zn-dependent dipeptidase
MAQHSILVDVTHMSARAVDDTFEVLDEVDPRRAIPVIASHATVRFGLKRYGLDVQTIERIADRDGVIGLIVADNLSRDGLAVPRPRTLQETTTVLCRHIDRLYELTGSHRHVAIGSDLGGFIRPLEGLEDSGEVGGLAKTLTPRYGPEVADAILAGNALRVLRVPFRAQA